ncbi:MAG: hypothetical protein ABI723_21880 [Bacteroidia bacterium]
MKKFLITLMFFTATMFAKSQAQVIIQNEVDTSSFGKASDKIYKFELRMPAQCIDKLIYQKTGDKVDYELSEDGETVYIKNFKLGSGLSVECTYKNGSRDAFNKTPCSLELVVPL